MRTKYDIYLYDRKSICPICSGMLAQSAVLNFYCIDCNSEFQVVDNGMTDNEVVCELIKRKIS